MLPLVPIAVLAFGSAILMALSPPGEDGESTPRPPPPRRGIDFDPSACSLLRASTYERNGVTVTTVYQDDGARVESSMPWDELLSSSPAGFERRTLTDGSGEVLVRTASIVRTERPRFVSADAPEAATIEIVLPARLRIRVFGDPP